MKIEIPREVDRFGAIRFYGLQKVFELDSGLRNGNSSDRELVIQQLSYEDYYSIQKDMAVIVPIRNERLRLMEGVLCGIPHRCSIIIVSNSPRIPVDRFAMEEEALNNFCTFVNKKAIIVHQKDPLLAQAFQKTGYSSILTRSGEIRDGKAEGMIIGTMIAWLAGKKYVGFVDADNYFPGAVEEYIREYAAGFHMSKSPYAMVRIAWNYKPKITEKKLFFRKWGRTSENTNRLLNRMLSHYYGFESELIKTGNAGEHAMTIELAKVLDYSSGYSVEPYHIINLVEKFGGIHKSPFPEVMQKGVEVFQIESRNPHLHEAGDTEHVDQMSAVAMQVMYHSTICPDQFKKELYADMVRRKFIARNNQPPSPTRFPALAGIDAKVFLEQIKPASYAHVIASSGGS
ncbi:MAG TPA: mannosyl-3-phosphoglycerate synthase [Thermodesulfobacteriota bacterium]|nr:mannosyl-3-phosphoglycerate synthase [Thermodesulfobacteriota bacterium]HOC38644.1 mannosyl-3-phosphoglycerate synthase [Thermodesulfobacteriota bacterium]